MYFFLLVNYSAINLRYIFRVRIDPLSNPQGPKVTEAFGEALTTALDVMTFTHELDIGGAAQGLNLANSAKPPTNKDVMRECI